MALRTCLLGILIGVVGSEAARTSNDQIKVEVNSKEKLVPVTLEDIYSDGYYSGKRFNGTWISKNEIMFRDNDTRDILTYNVEELTKTIFFNASVLMQTDWNSTWYSVSADKAYVLIGHSTVKRFGYSKYKKFVVYEIATGNYVELANGKLLSFAKWSPVGNSLAFILDNNVYHREISNGNITERQLTFDEVEDTDDDGVTDCTFDERTMNFSPNGTRLVVTTINDTDVRKAEYFYYGEPGVLKYQYPEKFWLRYPKPGTKKSEITLNVIDLNDTSASLVKLSAPEDVVGKEPIIPRLYWVSEELVIGTWTNRVQNVSQVVLYNATTGEASNILRIEESEGWVHVPKIVHEEGSLFLLKRQNTGTPAGSYIHLTRFSLDNGVLLNETDLTPGSQSVIYLIGIHTLEKKVYFTATGDSAPSQKNLYAVPVDGSEPPTCISCDFQTPEGNKCLYAEVSFSKDFSHYALACTGPDPVTVRVYNSSHEQVLSWEENEALRANISRVLSPIIKDFYVTVNGYDAKVRLRLPPQFNESDTHTKYPMLVKTYAGPGDVEITEDSSYGFGNYMTTNRSVIYASIDGRGSGHKGSKMLFEVYRHLGGAEVEDQIAVTKVLQKTYGWIDANRTAIWGWSYGGYTSTMALATDTDSVFKCAIAVAPVSSWIYYDSEYVEKYMGLPTEDDNFAGYNASDATRLVEGIRGKKFMLIHGTADDNVLYQQSLALSHALVTADIQFQQVSYTNEDHGLRGVYPHLYHTIDNFLGDCLDLEDLY